MTPVEADMAYVCAFDPVERDTVRHHEVVCSRSLFPNAPNATFQNGTRFFVVGGYNRVSPRSWPRDVPFGRRRRFPRFLRPTNEGGQRAGVRPGRVERAVFAVAVVVKIVLLAHHDGEDMAVQPVG